MRSTKTSLSIFGIFVLKYNEKVPKIIYNMNMAYNLLKVKLLLFISIFLMLMPFVYTNDYSDFYDSLGDAFSSFIDPNAGVTSFRSLGIPFGGRSEAMGTAYTAVTDDIAFLNYNPAISAVLPETEVAVFHNFWIADSAVDTIAASQRSGNFGYGAALKSFYVPFTEYNILGERKSQGYYSETVGLLNVSYNFLAGYHFKGIAIGGNFKVGYRSVPDYASDDTGYVIPGSGLSQSAVAFMGDIGFLLRFNLGKLYTARDPNLNIGLSITNIGTSFTGLGAESVIDDPLPTQATLGISYKIIRPLTLTLDFQQPINMLDFSQSEKFAFGFGFESVITDFFAMQCGFLLKGANPKISLGSELDWNDITFSLAYSLDLTTSLTPVNRISLSAKMNFGDRGRAELQDTVDALYTQGLNYYVVGEYLQAIAIWEEAIELYPLFDPALDGIRAANQSIELRDTIQDVQSLDVMNEEIDVEEVENIF